MANILASSDGNWNDGSTWIGGVVPTIGDTAYTNTRTIVINGDITCDLVSNRAENGATAGGILTLTISGVTIAANMQAGATTLLTVVSNVSLNVVGVLTGGTSNTVRAIVWNSPGTLTITGSPVAGTGGTAAHALVISHAAAIVNIVGDHVGSSVIAVCPVQLASTGTLNITGNITGGSFAAAEGVEVKSNGTVNITGNVVGGSSTTTYGVNVGAAATVNITGNVTGGSGTTAYGVYTNFASNITINGNVTGGSTPLTIGVLNNSVGTLTINGTSAASEEGGYGCKNTSTGIIYLRRAKGNSWGPTGSATGIGYGAQNTSVSGVLMVEEIEYGPNGMLPTLGNTFFADEITNKCITRQLGGGTKTLSDPNDTSGLVPPVEDVRSGIIYAGGLNTGTLNVPAASSVAAGVLVDNTNGQAVITIPILTSIVGQLLADNLSD